VRHGVALCPFAFADAVGSFHFRNAPGGSGFARRVSVKEMAHAVEARAPIHKVRGPNDFRLTSQPSSRGLGDEFERPLSGQPCLECQSACKFDPALEWAPGGGQYQAADLTVGREC
jgi:hypothetical protein